MTKRYTGGVISSSLPTVNAAGASGVFLLSQQADYQSRNSWPPFKVEESLRFRGAASAKLSRTVTTSSAGTKGTFSAWIKRGKDSDSTNNGSLVSAADNYYYGQFYQQTVYFGDTTYYLNTAAVFRDPAAWYHVVFVIDTTQATSSDRMQIWVNGIRQTSGSFAVYPTLNYTFPFLNNVQAWYIGGRASDAFFDGYMSEVYFVDGLALTPSSFGATDKDGNWSPIAYTGTYGQNGFYLNFSNNTSATTMGLDSSGNGNNWTLNNFNVSTANTTYDIMIDVPEDQSDGTANNRGNYCTWNPLNRRTSTHIKSTSNGNLSVSGDSDQTGLIYATIYPITGKWYFEFSPTNTYTNSYIGIGANNSEGQNQYPGNSTSSIGLEIGSGKVYKSSLQATYTGISGGEIGMIAWDCDTGKVWMGRQGAWFNSGNPAAGTGEVGTLTSGELGPMVTPYSSSGFISTTFGQRPFAYAPPSGFKTLNTFNLPEPTIKQPNKQFDVVTYTGDGNSTKSITGVNFQPGFAWVKSRSNAQINVLGDVLRGMPNRSLRSDSTDEEQTFGGGNIQSLDSNGITVSYGSVGLNTNESGYTYVAWQWNAGTANTTNTSGSITSQVRANPTAGFSIVTYTGTGGTGTTTVGHGLTVSPSMVMIKRRDVAANWGVYHTGLTSTSYYTLLNSFAAEANYGSTFISPGDSTLTIARDSSILNTNTGTYVAYCFATVAGYSAFGKYTGNGSTDGPFIYTGFRPRFVLLKSSSSGTDWYIYDTARNTYNLATLELNPNLSAAEQNNVYGSMDINSNGFKLRFATGEVNASGATYIYMAFAEAPFKYSRSR